MNILRILELADFRVPDVEGQTIYLLAQFLHPFFLVQYAGSQLAFCALITRSVLGPYSVKCINHRIQILFLLLEQLKFLPCIGRTEIAKGVIDGVIVHHETEITFF